jgi:hypothetical protein
MRTPNARRSSVAVPLLIAIAGLGFALPAHARIPEDRDRSVARPPLVRPDLALDLKLKQGAARDVGTTVEEIEHSKRLTVPIVQLVKDLIPNPAFVEVQLRYNPIRLAILMTEKQVIQTSLDIPVSVEVVPRSKNEMDEKVGSALKKGKGFRARADYVRGVVVITTDKPEKDKQKDADGDEFELGATPKPAASGGEQLLINGTYCTSGFRVNGNAIITAGHCRNAAGTIYPFTGGTQSIDAASNENCSVDAQTHTVIGASEPTVRGRSMGGTAAPFYGMYIEKYGRTTGWTSSSVTSTSTAWSYPVHAVDDPARSDCEGVTIYGFATGTPVAGGDSGGPIITCPDFPGAYQCLGVGITAATGNTNEPGTYNTWQGTNAIVLSAALSGTGAYNG